MARERITPDNLGHMEVDEDTGELSWKGAPAKTHHVHGLKRREFILALIVAVASLLSALHPFGQSFGLW